MMPRSAVIAGLALSIAATCAAQPLQTVYVQFDFDRGVCGRLPGRNATVGLLSGQLQPVVTSEYKFVSWRAAPEILVPDIPRLKVVLRSSPLGNGTEFHVDYWRYVKIDRNGSKMDIGSSTPLYRADEPDRAHPCRDLDLYLNPGKQRDAATAAVARKKMEGFVARLTERVTADLRAKRDELVKLFFNYVPLTHGVVTIDKKHGKSIVIGLSWAHLYADSGSLIELKVNEAVRGKLENVGQHDDIEERDDPLVCAKLTSFDRPQITPETNWTKKVADSLAAELARLAKLNQVEIVFKKYEPCPDTAKRIAEMLRMRCAAAVTPE